MNKLNTFIQVVLTVFCLLAVTEARSAEARAGTSACTDCEKLYQQAIACLKENREREGLEYLNASISKAEAAKDSFWIFKGLYRMGRYHDSNSRYKEALTCFLPLLKFSDRVLPNEDRSRIFDGIASIYFEWGMSDRAFDYYLDAEKFSRSIKDSVGQAMANYQMGRIYYHQGEYQRALDAYNKSMEVGRFKPDDRRQAMYLAALGSVYEKLEQPELANTYNNQALEIALKTNDFTLPYIYHNIGTIALKLNQRGLARASLLSSLDFFNAYEQENKGDSHAKIGVLLSLGKLESEEQNPTAAIKWLEEGLSLSLKEGFARREAEVIKELALIHLNQNKDNLAATYLSRYSHIQDSLFNDENRRHLELMKVQRQIEEEAAENEKIALLANRDKAEAQLKFKIFMIVSIGLAVILALLAYFIRLLRRSNSLLANRNELIQEQNQALEASNQALEEANLELKQFASVASHDLKEPLRTITSYAGLINRKYKNLVEEDDKTFFTYILEAPKRMQRLLEDLVNYASLQYEQAPAEKISLDKTLNTVVHNLSNRIGDSDASVKWEVNDLNLMAVPTQMEQLFQNLIGNGIKFHGEAAPVIRITAKKLSAGTEVTVSDNGIGIDPEFHDKIFGMFTRLHGKERFEGSGIGLATCKKIIERHGGHIRIDSTPGTGSKFILFFPASICSWERAAYTV